MIELAEPDLLRQIDVLWERDQTLGAKDSIHRKTLNPTAADTARAVDYAAGVRRAMSTSNTVQQAMRWYKHANHAMVIDVGMFRIGFERGRFIASRRTETILAAPITVPLAHREQYADIHFLYVPLSPGARLTGGQRVIDVRQALISATPSTLHLAPGQVSTDTGTVLVTTTLLHDLHQPALDFIPVGERLLRAVPNPRLR